MSITNSTVSHELRNPLQAMSCQSLKIELCLKEILSIISSKKQDIRREVTKIVKMLKDSNKIQVSSTSIMNFVVDDLLDYAQFNAGKFRKSI